MEITLFTQRQTWRKGVCSVTGSQSALNALRMYLPIKRALVLHCFPACSANQTVDPGFPVESESKLSLALCSCCTPGFTPTSSSVLEINTKTFKHGLQGPAWSFSPRPKDRSWGRQNSMSLRPARSKYWVSWKIIKVTWWDSCLKINKLNI